MTSPAAGERIRVPLTTAPYDIVLGAGVLEHLPELLQADCPAESYTILTDSTVARLLAADLADTVGRDAPCRLFHFPAGEWNKTRDTWSAMTDAMLRAGAGRDSAVLAVGGGVVGDLAGFVAATYHRGIPWVQIPTTLLAMIDSSIGGKTGVDTAFGKNLVGAFHQPRAVVADVNTLRSLPRHQMAAGAAEALKHGALADRTYFDAVVAASDRLLERDTETLTATVRRSVAIKAAVVAEDEREAGRRASLNAGHTVAHAIEATSGYELLHGEAVAIGLVAETMMGEALGITDTGTAETLRRAARRFALPLDLPAQSTTDALIDAMGSDKKSRRGAPRFALLRRIGDMARTDTGDWTFDIPENVIRAVLDGMR